MQTEKEIFKNNGIKENYERITTRIGCYFRGEHIPEALKEKKCVLFASGGSDHKIEIISNSLESMGFLVASEKSFSSCLVPLSDRQLASARGRSIDIWDMKRKARIGRLPERRDLVYALCQPREGLLVSGCHDASLEVWDLGTYKSRFTLLGHTSWIMGICRIGDEQVISGELKGDLRRWDITTGTCIAHIQRAPDDDLLWQMKTLDSGSVAVCLAYKVTLWGRENNWESPTTQYQKFPCGRGLSIEFLSGNILLRGDQNGHVDIIHMSTHIHLKVLPKLHTINVREILRIGKNIVVTVSDDGYLKVTDPISLVCYFNKNTQKTLYTLTKFL